MRNKNKEILFYISKNSQLEEEKKKCEVEIELLKELYKPNLKKFFDFYCLKTKPFVQYFIIIMLYILSQYSLYKFLNYDASVIFLTKHKIKNP